VLLVLPILALLAGCQRESAEVKATDSPALRRAVANATYPSQFVVSGQVTLSDGTYEEPTEPGAASRVRVALGDEVAFGAIGDHERAAALILRTTTGGSGTFVNLAAVPFDDDTPGQAVAAFLGDRVKVKSLKLEDGQIVIDLVTHAPDDPMCCPTDEKTEHFVWKGDMLVPMGGPVEDY